MRTVKHVLTENSAYEIDEVAQTIIRRPILGDGLYGDSLPISYLSYEVEVGEALRYIWMLGDEPKIRVTSRVLTIMNVETD